jgi:hypothetical protein
MIPDDKLDEAHGLSTASRSNLSCNKWLVMGPFYFACHGIDEDEGCALG